MMNHPCGSRGYEYINFKETCTISGVNRDFPIHPFRMADGNHHVILRADFVDYIYPYLAYRFGITGNDNSIVLRWSSDEWKYHSDMVYRNLFKDYRTTLRTLAVFEDNFLKADAHKIIY